MRIIAGIYKGRTLKSPPSMQVRPTSDRLRETLFNVIAPHIEDARFLDLCAGSGAVGIEALSRGAEHATFVDRSRKVSALIEANLLLCKIRDDEAEIYNSEVSEFLKQAVSSDMPSWDIIFYDPPYKDDPSYVLNFFAKHKAKLLSDDGLIIVEHHHKTELPVTLTGLKRTRVLKQGDSSLSFFAGVSSASKV